MSLPETRGDGRDTLRTWKHRYSKGGSRQQGIPRILRGRQMGRGSNRMVLSEGAATAKDTEYSGRGDGGETELGGEGE